MHLTVKVSSSSNLKSQVKNFSWTIFFYLKQNSVSNKIIDTKFGCGNRVDENMTNSCCSVLSDACRFIYDWHHAMAKHNIKKNLYFFILFEIKQVHITSY